MTTPNTTPNTAELNDAFLTEVRTRLAKHNVSARKASALAGLGEKYITNILRGAHRPSQYGALTLMSLLSFPVKLQRSFARNYVPTLANR